MPYWGFAQGFDYSAPIPKGPVAPRADVVVNTALEKLGESRKASFFHYLHLVDPHAPYNAPGVHSRLLWRSRSRRRAQHSDRVSPWTPPELIADMKSASDGESFFSDVQFGRFLDALHEGGLYDDAMIFFVADNGEEIGERGRGGHGGTLYDEVVRIPFLVKFPGNLHAGRVVGVPTSLVDVVPTVLAYLGAPTEGTLDGVDVLTLLEDPDRTSQRPLFFDLDRVYSKGDHNRARAIVRGARKYVEVTLPKPVKMLFDLEADRGELNNVYEAQAGLAEQVATELRARYAPTDAGVYLTLRNKRARGPAP